MQIEFCKFSAKRGIFLSDISTRTALKKHRNKTGAYDVMRKFLKGLGEGRV